MTGGGGTSKCRTDRCEHFQGPFSPKRLCALVLFNLLNAGFRDNALESNSFADVSKRKTSQISELANVLLAKLNF